MRNTLLSLALLSGCSAAADPGMMMPAPASHGAVIFFEPGTATQRSEARVGAFARHFMASVSSLAFGVQNRFATCQESRDDWNEGPQSPDDFMGPTLWSADLGIFAKIGQTFPKPIGGAEGSHLDMLHESPLCMGIAHERDNIYWAVDGNTGDIVRYDFVTDHGPGGGDHSDGRVRRYRDVAVTRVNGVASHLVFDSGYLYIADTGAHRILRLDTRTGDSPAAITGRHETLAEYTAIDHAITQVLIANAGDRPTSTANHSPPSRPAPKPSWASPSPPTANCGSSTATPPRSCASIPASFSAILVGLA